MYLKTRPDFDYDVPVTPERPGRPRPRRPSPKAPTPQYPAYRNPLPRDPLPNYPKFPKPKRPPLPIPYFPGAGAAGLGFGQWLDEWEWYKDERPWKLPGDWYFVAECGRLPGSPPYRAGGSDYNDGPKLDVRSGHIHNCSGGQVPSGNWAPLQKPGTSDAFTVRTILLDPFTGNYTAFISDSSREPHRFRHDQTYWHDSGKDILDTNVWYRPITSFSGSPMPDGAPMNPNVSRAGPGAPPWAPEPVPQPEPPPPVPWQWYAPGPPNPPPRPHMSRPPGPNEREKKVISKSARVGIFLWKLMDTISELTEIGGALYEGLPEDIRKKANCPDAVNIGQYGSDLNACMVETLIKNWHHLDAEEAIKAIAKNVAEDMTIGQFHKWLDKILPPGVSIEKTAITHLGSHIQPEVYIAGKLEELWDILGI